uniref:NR LBD domain-containing protein n=1 Tax=Acrobeloides nanus TaxID=290746 RepID=A0A914E147_9BILA
MDTILELFHVEHVLHFFDDKRVMCRSCRIKKCYSAGMKPEEVQVSRETPSKAQQSLSPNTNSPDDIITMSTNDAGITSQIHEISSTSLCSTSNAYQGNIYLRNSNSISPFIRSKLHQIIENCSVNYIFDETTLSPHYPTLVQMYMGYHRLLARRDQIFIRPFSNEGIRIYTLQDVFNVHKFANMNRLDLDGIAEMLEAFPGYKYLVIDEKVSLFKQFYSHFLILERIYESYRLLGTRIDDQKIVLVNGDVYEYQTMKVDIQEISDMSPEQVDAYIKPWFKIAPRKMLEPMKKLAPTETEMMFAFGYILWNIQENESKFCPETILFAKNMRSMLLDELSAYYKIELPTLNGVRRVGELMDLMNMTEKLVMQRNEHILLNKIFKYFKKDVFFHGLFDID